MIVKEGDNGITVHFAVCDCCYEQAEIEFKTWHGCQRWISENWCIKFNKHTREYEHLCDKCKNLK